MRKAVFLLILLTVLFAASLFVPGNSWSLIKNNKVVRRIGVTVYFFYGQGCPHCARVEPYINEMAYAYGLNVKRFEIYYNRSNMLLLQDYFNKYNVPANSRGIPIVFTSEGYIEGDINILNGFESLILNSSRANSQQVEASSQTSEAYSSENANVNPLSLFTITVAALVDSINPCSMAILFFLLAGLLLLHKRNKALKVGLAFTTSVFIANLLFGFGILTTIAVSGFSSVFKVAAGLIAVLTGVLLLKDAFVYGGGGFKMEVPEFLRPYLKHKLSKAFYGKSSSIISAFLVGFLVTSFEVPCTGGPYFYVLARMADDATRMQTIPILLYYNLIFVMPLVLITAMLYFGSVHVEKAREWKEQNKRLINFVRGLPMIGVGLITIPAAQISQTLNIYKTLYFPVIIPLIAYITFQLLSKNQNRNKTTKWIITTVLTATIVVTAITTAQTITPKQIKPKTTSVSAGLSSCTNPITSCPCVMDEKNTIYQLNEDLEANGDCIVITGYGSSLYCIGHVITGKGTGIGVNISTEAGVVRACKIQNFTEGIRADESGHIFEITYNVIFDNFKGINLLSDSHLIAHNILFNNSIGLMTDTGYYNLIFDNYFKENSMYNGYSGNDEEDYWNNTKSSGINIIDGPFIGGNYWDDYSGLDTDGDGIGDDPYTIPGHISNPATKDYLPLVDNLSPQYHNLQGPTGSFPYNPTSIYKFNITWKDNVELDKVIFELDNQNYTPSKINEYFGFKSNYDFTPSNPNSQVEHRANYSISFTGLEPGTHYYRWYANDTRNNWNSTMLYNFTIGIVDISIENITISSTNPQPNQPLNVSVTVKNLGNFTETFDLSLNYSWIMEPQIGTQTLTLAPGQTITINFTWTPTQYGAYNLTAYTSLIAYDINPENNQKTITVYVRVATHGGPGERFPPYVIK